MKSNFKNMKIAINEQQPLDDVVKELERLGYKKYNDLMSKKPIVVEAYVDGIYCLYSEDLHVCKETTITELKNME